MGEDALSAQQFPPPKKQRLRGYHLYGVSQEGEPDNPGWGGTLCPTCHKASVTGKYGPPARFHRTEEIRGPGDAYDVDVCNDCGRTIRMGKYL